MNNQRIFNAFLYALMSPVGFLGGWYAATGDYVLMLICVGIEMVLEL